MRDHLDVEDMDVCGLMDVLFSYVVDDAASEEGVTRPQAREAVYKWMEGTSGVYRVTEETKANWGLQSDHQAGIDRALAMVGGVPSG